jgi:ferrous iron transport protein B
VTHVEKPQPLAQARYVALVGNPNCGKTTLFNVLTGSSYKVANYPGVTVEKREGSVTLAPHTSVQLVDLPGTYSLSGTTLDEHVATQYLLGTMAHSRAPDLAVAVVDASNLERNLFLVSELLDTGVPCVLALNMMDIAEEREIKIYVELLSRSLDIPVVPIVARTGKGLPDLLAAITRELLHPSRSRRAFAWIPTSHASATHLRAIAAPNEIYTRQADDITTIATLRYAWIRHVVSRAVVHSPRTQRRASSLDAFVTSKVWGLPLLAAIFFVVFQSIYLWAQIPMEYISAAIDHCSRWLADTLPPGMLTELLTEGIVPGVGNVLVFVPQIAILFFCIGLLEDSGYLSRAAFLLDNFMRKVGLQGRAFIPLLSSFACAVPGILSTRTIPSRLDRLTTIMIAPLMSCSARLPVYTVLIAAAVPASTVGGVVSLQGLVLLSMYLLGILGACAVAYCMHKVSGRKESCFFVMEMPPLRLPILRVVLRSAYDSVLSFIKNATTIILACSIVIWFLASYPKAGSEHLDAPVRATYAGKLGSLIEPAIKPLGFNWEIGFAIIASFPAREVFITGLSTVLSVQDDDGESHASLISTLRTKRSDGSFSTLTALSLMVFYVFACQCMSTLAVCRRETGSWIWTGAMFTYMTALAYLASLLTYQVGIRLGGL